MNNLRCFKATLEINGENLYCKNHFGNQLIIPLGKGVEHTITTRLIAKMNMPIFLSSTTGKADVSLALLVIEILVAALFWVLYYQTKALRRKDLCALDLKDYEPLGLIYNEELNLCFACLDFWDNNNLYENSNDISALDIWERLIGEHICDALNSGHLRSSKEKNEKEIQYLLSCFDLWINPYSPEESLHHFNIIESAIMIGQSQSTDNVPMRKARKRFRDGAWKAYKDAWQAYKRAIHDSKRGLKMLHIDDDELYLQMTRRTRLCITNLIDLKTKSLPQIRGV